MTTYPTTTAPCRAEYVRPGGRERGDRIVECVRPAGHGGLHWDENGTMWLDRETEEGPQ